VPRSPTAQAPASFAHPPAPTVEDQRSPSQRRMVSTPTANTSRADGPQTRFRVAVVPLATGRARTALLWEPRSSPPTRRQGEVFDG
jgi:hypothetical protein